MDIWNEVEHGYVDSNGVKLHYVTIGEGPLVVMIHGFPDFWYTWRYQMDALKEQFQVVAFDQRGYNKSGQPDGVAAYDMSLLTADVAAIVRHLGQASATIVGHDWGGFVAWQFAMRHPELTANLIVLNLPHPNGFFRELATNPVQRENSAYARRFQEKMPTDPDITMAGPMTADALLLWVQDGDALPYYREAMARSSFEGMLNYYKRNYPRPEQLVGFDPDQSTLPIVKAPVLQFHGLNDTALHADGLNNTWEWLEKDLTLVTVPGAGHFVQHDAADFVSDTMKWWLLARQ